MTLTLEELYFLRCIANEEIIDYLEYCDTGASSHGGLELWTYGKN